jgi:hypothetical protein
MAWAPLAVALCLPGSLARAARALPSPNAAAARRREAARAAGPRTTRLHRNPHPSVRRHSASHGGWCITGIDHNSIGNSDWIANGCRARSAARLDDDAPIAIETAACKAWAGNDQRYESQQTSGNKEPNSRLVRQTLNDREMGITAAHQNPPSCRALMQTQGGLALQHHALQITLPCQLP